MQVKKRRRRGGSWVHVKEEARTEEEEEERLPFVGVGGRRVKRMRELGFGGGRRRERGMQGGEGGLVLGKKRVGRREEGKVAGQSEHVHGEEEEEEER